MKEFEYSFTVDSAPAFHKYCLTVHPLEVSAVLLRRRVYKDSSRTIARITEETAEGIGRNFLDFKSDSPNDQLIKHVEETPEIIFSPEKMPYVLRLLDVIGYKLSIELIKTRTRYSYAGFHIDVDEYSVPYKRVVIEIEGDPAQAEGAYRDMQKQVPHLRDV